MMTGHPQTPKVTARRWRVLLSTGLIWASFSSQRGFGNLEVLGELSSHVNVGIGCWPAWTPKPFSQRRAMPRAQKPQRPPRTPTAQSRTLCVTDLTDAQWEILNPLLPPPPGGG